MKSFESVRQNKKALRTNVPMEYLLDVFFSEEYFFPHPSSSSFFPSVLFFSFLSNAFREILPRCRIVPYRLNSSSE